MSAKPERKGGTPAEWIDASVWAPTDSASDAPLVSAGSLKRMEINGASVIEQSHEYVLRKSPDASNR